MIAKVYETENKTIYNNSRKPKNFMPKNMKHDNHKEDILMFPKSSNQYLTTDLKRVIERDNK
jgi:hypothetical protein